MLVWPTVHKLSVTLLPAAPLPLRHSPHTSKVSGSNHGYYVGKLVVMLTDGRQFTVQKLDQLYVLVSSDHKTTGHDMTCTVLNLFIWGFTSLSTLYRSYHDG